MGVITTPDRTINLKSSVSEETLYIPSSDDDRSVASLAVRHSQARILRHRIPTVGGPSVTVKPHCGKKKSRRYNNVSQLVTLAEEDELKEVSITDFVESSRTPFTRLLEDEDCRQKWEEFVSSSEESQEQIIEQERKMQTLNNSTRQLNANLRALIKKRSVPLGMLHYLEEELVSFFSNMPKDIYISPKLSSFERLLLHSLSDYHRLISLSFDKQPERVRLVRVKNPQEEFPAPDVLLTKYLETQYGAQ